MRIPDSVQAPSGEQQHSRRINVYGGPGCGKSTIASRLYGELRALGHNVEFVPEYIKTWAYAGRVPKPFDQIYIFSKQLYTESQMLEHVDHVVCECPLLLAIAYAMRHQTPCWREQMKIALEFERHYPATHIMLDRDTIPYVQHGRYETEQEAIHMDGIVELMLTEAKLPWSKAKSTDFAAVMDIAHTAIL